MCLRRAPDRKVGRNKRAKKASARKADSLSSRARCSVIDDDDDIENCSEDNAEFRPNSY
jgi:hypothetical protein